MDESTIYTRVYSANSPRQFISGQGLQALERHLISGERLLDEFRQHAKKNEPVPTALVSVSIRMIDTVQRAFAMYSGGESPENIWVVFVEVPENIHGTQIHAARPLAEELKQRNPLLFRRNPSLFHYERVFEWEIPEEYVLHKVSLRTLIDRGIEEYMPQLGSQDGEELSPSTQTLRDSFAHYLSPHGYTDSLEAWGISSTLVGLAKAFGYAAPLSWIAVQLYFDCTQPKTVPDREAFASNFYNDDFDKALEDAIDTRIHDFDLSVKVFREEKDEMKDLMMWQFIDLLEEWHYMHYMYPGGCQGCCGKACISDEDMAAYDEAVLRLEDRHKVIRADLEAEAAALGL